MSAICLPFVADEIEALLSPIGDFLKKWDNDFTESKRHNIRIKKFGGVTIHDLPDGAALRDGWGGSVDDSNKKTPKEPGTHKAPMSFLELYWHYLWH